jgi:hypothetical protein
MNPNTVATIPDAAYDILAFQLAIFLVRCDATILGQVSIDFVNDDIDRALNSLSDYGNGKGDFRIYGRVLHHSIGMFSKYIRRKAYSSCIELSSSASSSKLPLPWGVCPSKFRGYSLTFVKEYRCAEHSMRLKANVDLQQCLLDRICQIKNDLLESLGRTPSMALVQSSVSCIHEYIEVCCEFTVETQKRFQDYEVTIATLRKELELLRAKIDISQETLIPSSNNPPVNNKCRRPYKELKKSYHCSVRQQLRATIKDTFILECNKKAYSIEDRVSLAKETFQSYDLAKELNDHIKSCTWRSPTCQDLSQFDLIKHSSEDVDPTSLTLPILNQTLDTSETISLPKASKKRLLNEVDINIEIKEEPVDYCDTFTSQEIKQTYLAIRKKCSYRIFSAEERQFALYFYFLEFDWHRVQPVGIYIGIHCHIILMTIFFLNLRRLSRLIQRKKLRK